MTRRFSLFLAGISLLAITKLIAAERPRSDDVPGIDPIPANASMTQDQVVDYFENLKRGARITLTLEGGKKVNGVFSSYDDYYETVWIVPRKSEKGMFNQKGYKITGIQSVSKWEGGGQNPPPAAKPFGGPASSNSTQPSKDDYYLLKQDGAM